MLNNMEEEVLRLDRNEEVFEEMKDEKDDRCIQKTSPDGTYEPEVVAKDSNFKNSSWFLLKQPKEVSTFKLEVDLSKLYLW